MTDFIKPIILTIIIIGFLFAFTLTMTMLVVVPVLDLIGLVDFSGKFGRFEYYSFKNWFVFAQYVLGFAGGHGFLLGAFFGHAVGWGFALRLLSTPIEKMFIGLIGSAMACGWALLLLFLLTPYNIYDFMDDIYIDPILQFVVTTAGAASAILVLISHRTNWFSAKAL